jgi:IMP dehydrogenase
MPKVKDIMTTRNDLIILKREELVRQALDVIKDRHIHGVMVYPGSGFATWGIFTTSDAVSFKASHLDANRTTIGEVANPVMYSAQVDWDVDDCFKQMARNNVEHLPVIEANGDLVGIVSSTDLEPFL